MASYHTRSDEVGRVAAQANAKLLVLNHFVPTRFDRDAVLAEVARDYSGPVAIGEDLMRFDCAARRLAHRDLHLQLGRKL